MAIFERTVPYTTVFRSGKFQKQACEVYDGFTCVYRPKYGPPISFKVSKDVSITTSNYHKASNNHEEEEKDDDESSEETTPQKGKQRAIDNILKLRDSLVKKQLVESLYKRNTSAFLLSYIMLSMANKKIPEGQLNEQFQAQIKNHFMEGRFDECIALGEQILRHFNLFDEAFGLFQWL